MTAKEAKLHLYKKVEVIINDCIDEVESCLKFSAKLWDVKGRKGMIKFFYKGMCWISLRNIHALTPEREEHYERLSKPISCASYTKS